MKTEILQELLDARKNRMRADDLLIERNKIIKSAEKIEARNRLPLIRYVKSIYKSHVKNTLQTKVSMEYSYSFVKGNGVTVYVFTVTNLASNKIITVSIELTKKNFNEYIIRTFESAITKLVNKKTYEENKRARPRTCKRCGMTCGC